MKIKENFYSGDAIDAAYKSVNKAGSSGSASAAKKKNVAKSTKQNLWEFLGLSNLDEKQMACTFDCSIKGADCLEKCQRKNKNKKDDSCTYKCSSEGLKCMKKCILPPKPKPKPTTSSIKKEAEVYECVEGVDSNSVDFAPYKSSLWPQFSSNIGWNTNKIEEHNKSTGVEKIEVNVKNYYPFVKSYKIDKKDQNKLETELLKEIRWNPHVLEGKSAEYTDNKEFMKKAVNANWQALQYASKKLRGDKDVVYIAVKQNWVALQYADEKLKPEIEWKM